MIRVEQLFFENNQWGHNYGEQLGTDASLVLNFGAKNYIKNPETVKHLKHKFPAATIVSCSTSGEIHNNRISDHTCCATAITFEHTQIKSVQINIRDFNNCVTAGHELVSRFDKENLKLIFVISDGQLVNGSDLVTGMNEASQNEIPISGGLAGDGPDFTSTYVGLNSEVDTGNIVAVGFYGERIKVSYGSEGGWKQFGPTRTITLSDKNVLYEIDGEPALDLYKRYLGEHAQGLPLSALFFPLAIETEGAEVVRTVLNIDEEKNSVTFAGNVPEGARLRLMKANFDRLIDAASIAAENSNIPEESDKLAILISCVGRKMIFGNRVDEELEVARETLGKDTVISGFYSYGEIAPFSDFMKCELHNQTMTITTISEY